MDIAGTREALRNTHRQAWQSLYGRIARRVLADIPEGEQAGQVRRSLAAFLGLGEGDEFDAVLLDQMTPELLFRLDIIAVELLELGQANEAVRALRGALIRQVNYALATPAMQLSD